MTKDPSERTTEPRVVWHPEGVKPDERAQSLGQTGCVLWFTGLSGSGKSTIANALDRLLIDSGRGSFLLDGDNIRHGLCATPKILEPTYGSDFASRFGLGFSEQDREENIRRVGEVTYLMACAGLVCLTAFVSPYRRDRDRVRMLIKSNPALRFYEIFVDTPIEVCEARDPKGLYRQARAGMIPNFTGVSDPYEAPQQPECIIRGSEGTPEEHASRLLSRLIGDGLIPAREVAKA